MTLPEPTPLSAGVAAPVIQRFIEMSSRTGNGAVAGGTVFDIKLNNQPVPLRYPVGSILLFRFSAVGSFKSKTTNTAPNVMFGVNYQPTITVTGGQWLYRYVTDPTQIPDVNRSNWVREVGSAPYGSKDTVGLLFRFDIWVMTTSEEATLSFSYPITVLYDCQRVHYGQGLSKITSFITATDYSIPLLESYDLFGNRATDVINEYAYNL